MLRFVFSLSLLLTASCGGRIDVEEDPTPSTDENENENASAGSPVVDSFDSDAPPRTKTQLGEGPARAACRACRGDWGRHGLSPIEGCNCRTEDFGASCADSSECEGQCLADAPGQMVVEPGPPRRGFFVGQCSEFRASFGCHSVLSDGFNLGEPVLLDEGVPMRCLD
jgi:hypothetical protein